MYVVASLLLCRPLSHLVLLHYSGQCFLSNNYTLRFQCDSKSLCSLSVRHLVCPLSSIHRKSKPLLHAIAPELWEMMMNWFIPAGFVLRVHTIHRLCCFRYSYQFTGAHIRCIWMLSVRRNDGACHVCHPIHYSVFGLAYSRGLFQLSNLQTWTIKPSSHCGLPNVLWMPGLQPAHSTTSHGSHQLPSSSWSHCFQGWRLPSGWHSFASPGCNSLLLTASYSTSFDGSPSQSKCIDHLVPIYNTPTRKSRVLKRLFPQQSSSRPERTRHRATSTILHHAVPISSHAFP